MSRNVYLPDDDYALRYYQSGTWKRACRRARRRSLIQALLVLAGSGVVAYVLLLGVTA
jgi:hypothetical protein